MFDWLRGAVATERQPPELGEEIVLERDPTTGVMRPVHPEEVGEDDDT